jgi:hypothetical protein
MTSTTVHTAAEIERMLSLGLSPITDNVQALTELGFERSFPQAKNGGYEASVYERFVERGNRRNKAQRAFLRID